MKIFFLLANISIDITLEIFFFSLSNIKSDFDSYYLYCKTYTIAKVCLITKHVKFIKRKEFAITDINFKNKAFIVHVVFIS